MDNKLKHILDQNEKKGANYGGRLVNKEGIIFDYSSRGYHVRVKNVKQ